MKPHLADRSGLGHLAWSLGIRSLLLALIVSGWMAATRAAVYTTTFFNASQTSTVISSTINSVTIQSGDYRFTYSVDGYWSPYQGGQPTGRFFSVNWPTGVQAQAITAGPLVGTGANITIKRADGKKFDLRSFTGKILLNTAGAGGAFEIMPLLNGNDGYPDPLQYDCTGYSGMSFPYTPALTNYDTYKIHMWGDFALTALTIDDTNPPSGGGNYTVATSIAPAGAGTTSGGGTFASGAACTVTATANAGWGFQNWTENGAVVSQDGSYAFSVTGNRTLTANFVPRYTVALSASPANGAVSLSGGGTYDSGTLVTVTATPAVGYQFAGWSEAGSPTVLEPSTTYSFSLTANLNLVASFTINHPPVAMGGSFFQVSGQLASISLFDLIALDYDPDGDAISVTDVAATTAHGRAVTVDWNAMQLTIPSGTGADTFTYTLSDGNGGTATGTASLAVIPGVDCRSAGLDLASAANAVTANFQGTPWYTYTAQRCADPSFTGPTLQSWTAQAWADGSIAVYDDFADLGGKPQQAFYRLMYP